MIPFNKPFIAGKELYYIAQAVTLGNISGDGHFTQACSRLLEERFGIHRVLLAPSGTAALELAAMLCGLEPGDEVIMPSYTFVSTASAFLRCGARPVFVDIRPDTLNLDETKIEAAITPRTRCIVPVHYAGVACEMDPILEIAARHNLVVVEDAAQGVNAFYKGRALGALGQLGCYSFHETKNYTCGEGGALCINQPALVQRAEILRDKGTNRQQFFRGEVDKYTWVDLGSSFVISEICAAFLYGQLEHMDQITQRPYSKFQIRSLAIQCKFEYLDSRCFMFFLKFCKFDDFVLYGPSKISGVLRKVFNVRTTEQPHFAKLQFFLNPLLFLSRALTLPKARRLSEFEQYRLAAKMHKTPSWPVNLFPKAIFAAETPLGHWIPFPWGTSLLGVFQKPLDERMR